MAFNLGDIFVTFKANTDALQKGLGDVQNLANKTKDVSSQMSDAFGKSLDASKAFALGVTAAGAAVTAFGVSSVKAYEESQNVQAQLNTALNSTHHAAGLFVEDLNDQAKALQRLTTFSDEQINASQALLLTFTNIHGAMFQEATPAILDMATAMHEDLQTATIQVGKALNDPILGVTSLRRVGVQLSEQQKDQVDQFMKVNNVAGAQAIILGELNKEFGGSAAAAGGTFSGALARLKNSLNDVQETIGKMIIDFIQPFLDKMLLWYDRVGGAEGVMNKLKEAFERIKPYFPAIIGFIVGGLTPALLAMAAAGLSNLFWLSPFLIAGAALGYLWNHNRTVFILVAAAIAAFAVGLMVMMLPAIIASTTAFAGMAVAVIAATWPFVLAGIAIAGLAILIVKNWSTITVFFKALWADITRYATDAWNWIKHATNDVWHAIYTVVKPIIDAIATAFMIWLTIYTYIFDVIRGLAIVFWNWLYGTLIKPIIDNIKSQINDIVAAFSFVWNALRGPAQSVWDFLKAGFSAAWGFVAGIWGGVANWFAGIWNKIASTANGLGGSISGAFSSALGAAQNIVKSAINWMIDRVNGVIHAVNNSAGKLPGVPKIGDIPRLFTGVDNFMGGLAIVGDVQGQGGEIAVLPQGTQVLNNTDSKKLLAAQGKGGSNAPLVGEVHIYNNVDQDEFFRKLARAGEIVSNGMATPPGSLG